MYNPYNYEYLNTPEGGDDKWYDTIAKRARIQYESIWFIIFEIWRFWLAVDGVLHGNSMTISVTFFSTAFAIVLGAMQIVECTKVIEYTRLSVVPQIIMTSLLCAVAVPTLYATYKMYRHSDWIKFHKLGPDVSLHVMYHWVQCFVLVIKGDMFFQAMALCLYFAVLAFSYERWYPFIIVLAPIVTIAFLYLGRRGIAKESQWMMILFTIFEVLLTVFNIFVLVIQSHAHFPSYWYFLYAYGMGV
ncbi:hypothetical protein J3Q64DRAFT_1385307 [Phycomyces blakesleeanus]|uniref:Chitin synthase export chaperone n=1 Tax=Phycomyces blakesleeanus TaxID=4837 RepID=A0ABR3AJP0_PHYBL